MPQTTLLRPLHPCQHAGEERDSLFTGSPRTAENLEDVRLAERVKRALRATGYGALRSVAISVSARVVMLLGRVPSYHLKQIAQTTALAVSGTHQIDNGLQVVRPS